jgi:exonuclease SbcD
LIRFLHAADLHLDSPLLGLEKYEGAPADRIRGATRRALENLVKLAIAERVQFVILAGDIYDGAWNDAGTGMFFLGEMLKLKAADIPVFLISGNHDAASKIARHLPASDSYTLLPHDQPRTIRLDSLGVALHGQSYSEPAVTANLALAYPAAVKGMLNIGLLHTALTGRDGHARYAPCMLDDLLTRNYDYWALGHIHLRESVNDRRTPWVEFPGNIQGRHIREQGPKGCLLVTLGDAGAVHGEFRPLDVVRWSLVRVDCEDVTRREEIDDRIKAELANAHAEAEGRLLAARVELVGVSPLHNELQAQAGQVREAVRALALNFADSIWIEKVRVATSAVEESSSEPALGEDALSEIAAVAAELAENPEELQRLFEAEGVKALSAKVPEELKEGESPIALGDPAWIRTLLNRAQAILAAEAAAKGAKR